MTVDKAVYRALLRTARLFDRNIAAKVRHDFKMATGCCSLEPLETPAYIGQHATLSLSLAVSLAKELPRLRPHRIYLVCHSALDFL